MKKVMVWWLATLLCVIAWAQPRQRIEKAADLPRFSYPVTGSLEQLVRDEKAFDAFAGPLRRDIEGVLSQYDIADKSMQRQMLGTLLVLDLLERRDAAALTRIETIRALQDKPADKLLTGLQARAIVEARQAVGNDSSDAYQQEVARRIGEALRSMPYAVVANEVKEAKAGAELIGESLVLGRLRDVLQPVVDKAGALSSDLAPGVVSARYTLTLRLPLKQALVDSYGAFLAANKSDKPDIWATRNVRLAAGAGHAPVTVAVWDSGVDSALFGRQVLRDPNGKPRLIAFDKYSNRSNGELEPIPRELQAKLPTMKARSKGFSDLQSNIDSPEAAEIKRYLSALKPDEYKAAIEEIGLTGNYEHGTHVAGIALQGNPYARLLIARIEFGHTLMPDPCPSRAQAEKDARALLQTVAFFKRHRARVVNMSWGGSVRAIETDLERCGTGKTPDERKTLAREYFEISRQAMIKGFSSAPEILWITAAGNSNEDASFAEDAPADIVLPNLLTVGAVDQAGDEASFTSYGPTVKVHANGYQVESFLPGGDRVALSGTSMASPQVANLAGKLLAVNPRLTPAQVIEFIVSTADKTADGRRALVNPANALQAVLARKKR
jgi:subtilisin family serine protease